jgi:spore germination protein KC
MFTPVETRGILWLKGEMVHSSIIIDSLAGKDGKDGKASFIIQQYSSRTKAIFEGRKPVINVEINADFDLAEDLTDIDFLPHGITWLEEELAKAVANEIKHTIRRAQQFNCDIFGFGKVIQRSFPNKWPQIKKNWDVLFPNLSVSVQVRAHIRRMGMTAEHPDK